MFSGALFCLWGGGCFKKECSFSISGKTMFRLNYGVIRFSEPNFYGNIPEVSVPYLPGYSIVFSFGKAVVMIALPVLPAAGYVIRR